MYFLFNANYKIIVLRASRVRFLARFVMNSSCVAFCNLGGVNVAFVMPPWFVNP